MVHGGGDEHHRGQRCGQQGHKEDDLLELVDHREALAEGQDQQEGEQHLHARQGNSKLVEQLDHVAIDPLLLGLVALAAARIVALVGHPVLS